MFAGVRPLRWCAAMMSLGLALAVHAVGRAQTTGRITSGFDLMSPPLQAMQRDDASNPGMLWVLEGRERWAQPQGPARRACSDCHGPTPQATLRGVAARYPAWDASLARPLTLSERIDRCRSQHQGHLTPSGDTLALAAALAHASRGEPVSPAADPRMVPWRERGRALWTERIGQLDLSCAQCHDDRVGLRLGGATIPPGQTMGYPTYRLEWQGLGLLDRRVRNCMTGVRARPFAEDSEEMRALQVFLAWRDRGLPMEAPAVRP